jgi:FMN reductase
MHALLISASPSERSRSAALLDAAGHALVHAGVEVRHLALRTLPAEPLLHARTADAELRAALERVAGASALVIATPIYKAAYSGLLKVFLDLLPQDALHDAWVWPLATGGSPAHTLAIDHSLRPVLDNLGAHQVVPSVFALDAQIVWSGANAQIDAAIQARLAAGAARLARGLGVRAPRALAEIAPDRMPRAALAGAARCSA